MNRLITMMVMAGLALPAVAQKAQRFEAEIDPIAYVLKGYSVHGIFVNNRLRTDLGFFGIEQPEGYNGNDGYQVKTHGVGLKMNYLLDKKEHWFSGVGVGYANNTIVKKETPQSARQGVMSVGAHFGYRWFLFGKKENAWRNLYLTPWMSVDYNMPVTSVKFESEGYSQKAFTLFPTVHIGYRFVQ
jgi:hypothetical protein